MRTKLLLELALAAAAAMLSGCQGDSLTDLDTTDTTGSTPLPGDINLVPVASGLAQPLYVTAPPGDSRLFIVEQAGRIRVMRNGAVLSTPFLDISARVRFGGEEGLLSLAFHPQYATNGFFFINYVNLNGDVLVERFHASSGSDVANGTSGTPILTIPHPGQNHHNGGLLLFAPDGKLWISMGDGGGQPEPAQDPASLLGKVLRIDVNAGSPYAIPPDNPYANHPTNRREIWALGLRNPWRFAIDPTTALLYIADVGETEWEEVHVQAVASAAVNYGWPTLEGTHCRSTPTCNQTGLELPVLEYDHGQGCSITGGFVYRGNLIPGLAGHYFYSDYCTAFIRSFRYSNGSATDLRAWDVGTIGQITSFGQDAARELYVVSRAGTVYKFAP